MGTSRLLGKRIGSRERRQWVGPSWRNAGLESPGKQGGGGWDWLLLAEEVTRESEDRRKVTINVSSTQSLYISGPDNVMGHLIFRKELESWI